jgi:hypothetical protein
VRSRLARRRFLKVLAGVPFAAGSGWTRPSAAGSHAPAGALIASPADRSFVVASEARR